MDLRKMEPPYPMILIPIHLTFILLNDHLLILCIYILEPIQYDIDSAIMSVITF